MPTIKFDLHTHERKASYDSSTPAKIMSSVYNTLGYDAVGFVGHDEIANVESEELIVFNGVEREVSEDPEIHIVEYPEIGISFLAHPQRENMSKSRIRDLIQEHRLNGVEKFSNGFEQYDGNMDGVLELANDDAHNIFQIGTSFMQVDVNSINRGQIVQALQSRDRIELQNKRRRLAGETVKTVNSAVGRIIKQ